MDNLEKLIAAIQLTHKMKSPNSELADSVLDAYVLHLAKYKPSHVMVALTRVQTECKFFNLSDVIGFINDQDGRPGTEEAWSLVSLDDNETFVMTDEMAVAHGVALNAYAESGNKVDARMAFKEKYESELTRARANGIKANWFVSIGKDKRLIEAPVRTALKLGRISKVKAQAFLPSQDDGVIAGMLESGKYKLPAKI